MLYELAEDETVQVKSSRCDVLGDGKVVAEDPPGLLVGPSPGTSSERSDAVCAVDASSTWTAQAGGFQDSPPSPRSMSSCSDLVGWGGPAEESYCQLMRASDKRCRLTIPIAHDGAECSVMGHFDGELVKIRLQWARL